MHVSCDEHAYVTSPVGVCWNLNPSYYDTVVNQVYSLTYVIRDFLAAKIGCCIVSLVLVGMQLAIH